METVATDDRERTGQGDSGTARERIRERGERIREREQASALGRLGERRDLSERERRVVRDLARRVTDRLLSVPESHLRAVDYGETDREIARVAVDPYDVE